VERVLETLLKEQGISAFTTELWIADRNIWAVDYLHSFQEQLAFSVIRQQGGLPQSHDEPAL